MLGPCREKSKTEKRYRSDCRRSCTKLYPKSFLQRAGNGDVRQYYFPALSLVRSAKPNAT